MANDQFKVPEGVLEAFRNAHPFALVPADKGGHIEGALAAALAQHHKELLGDKAVSAAAIATFDDYGPGEVVLSEVGIQAAIDSVMKGGDSG